MTYNFKKLEEFGWFVAVSALTFAFTFFSDFNPDKISDWHLWAVSLGAGLVRAVAGAALAGLAKFRNP